LYSDSNYTIFAASKQIIKLEMKRLKVSEIIRLLLDDGWIQTAQRGSHRQFKNPEKSGKVTVNGKLSDTLSQEVLNSIFKQAGWK
jgi:hypothetical protein